MTADLEKLFEHIRSDFNRKAESDPAFQQQLAGVSKKIVFCLTDGGNWYFELDNGVVPSITRQVPMVYDIKIMTDSASLIALLSGKLDPMKAMVGGKVKVSSSLKDVVWLKKLMAMSKQSLAGVMKDFETR
jgi:putative sterol carrier protein